MPGKAVRATACAFFSRVPLSPSPAYRKEAEMQSEKAGVGQVPSPSTELETLRARIKQLEATLQGSQARFRHGEQELEALQATVLDLTSAHDLPFLLETIVERAADLLDAPAGGLYLYEPQEEQVRCVVSHNTVRDYRGVVLKVGEGAAGTVAEIRRPLIIDDYGTWPGRAPAFEEERPFRAVLAVPMIWQGQIIGVIDVVYFAPDRVFSEQDCDLLMLFASHAAIAVKNSRLYEQARAEIAARERLERQIEERRRYLEHVLACAPDAIVTLDPEHRVLEWNPGAEALFGYSAQEAIGRDLDDLIAAPEPEIYAQAVDLTEEAFAGRSVPPTETIRFRKDGTPVHVILAGSPIFIQDEMVGVVVVYTDISEHKRLTEELRQISGFSQGIVENMGEGVAVQDAEGFFTPGTAPDRRGGGYRQFGDRRNRIPTLYSGRGGHGPAGGRSGLRRAGSRPPGRDPTPVDRRHRAGSGEHYHHRHPGKGFVCESRL